MQRQRRALDSFKSQWAPADCQSSCFNMVPTEWPPMLRCGQESSPPSAFRDLRRRVYRPPALQT